MIREKLEMPELTKKQEAKWKRAEKASAKVRENEVNELTLVLNNESVRRVAQLLDAFPSDLVTMLCLEAKSFKLTKVVKVAK